MLCYLFWIDSVMCYLPSKFNPRMRFQKINPRRYFKRIQWQYWWLQSRRDVNVVLPFLDWFCHMLPALQKINPRMRFQKINSKNEIIKEIQLQYAWIQRGFYCKAGFFIFVVAWGFCPDECEHKKIGEVNPNLLKPFKAMAYYEILNPEP